MNRAMGQEIIGESIATWDSALERHLFGTEDPAVIDGLLDAWCAERLGRRADEILFYRRGVGGVFGLVLEGGTTAVVKVHRRELVADRLPDIVRVQEFSADRGVSAPRPLCAPAPLGAGIATAEELLRRGAVADATRPEIRRALARGLYELVAAVRPLVGTVELGRPHGPSSTSGFSWPLAHDLRFDLTLREGEWIDALAEPAHEELQEPSGELVIGHADWRIENLRLEGARVAAIFDWDSVVETFEPALVGGNAVGFTADWSDPGGVRLPTLDESRAFALDYERARGRPFNVDEWRTLNAARLFELAYNARCELSDVALGVFPDPGADTGWRGMLRQLAGSVAL